MPARRGHRTLDSVHTVIREILMHRGALSSGDGEGRGGNRVAPGRRFCGTHALHSESRYRQKVQNTEVTQMTGQVSGNPFCPPGALALLAC
jgi:hypothetical protein